MSERVYKVGGQIDMSAQLAGEMRGYSFGFLPIGEHYEYRRLKWWNPRKTKVRVLTDLKLYEYGFAPSSVLPDATPPATPTEDQ